MSMLERPTQLGGEGQVVCIDEMYSRHTRTSGKGARVPVRILGMACDSQVLTGLIPDQKATTIIPCIEKYVAPGSIIITDLHKAYSSLSRRGWDHRTVNHRKREWVVEPVSNNLIETYWARLRRHLNASQNMNIENAWKFIAECEFKYNRQSSNNSEFETLISAFPPVNTASIVEAREKFEWGI